MDYVYSAYFSDKTVKFGRTTNVYKRMLAHDADAKKFGIALVLIAFTPVADGVREERLLHTAASEILRNKTKETFQCDGPADMMAVFESVRLPYVLCRMSTEQFGPVIEINSFSPQAGNINLETPVARDGVRKARIEKRILKTVDTYSGSVTKAILTNRILNYPADAVESVLLDMIADGIIVNKEKDNGTMVYARP